MAIWGLGEGGMYGKYEQWSSGGVGPYDATRGWLGRVRVGEAKTPGSYSEGGATRTKLVGKASTQELGSRQLGWQRSTRGSAGDCRSKLAFGFDHPEAEDPLDVLDAELANGGGKGPLAALDAGRWGGVELVDACGVG